MSVIDDYLNSLSGSEKSTIEHMYHIVREMIPEATEEISYAMPTIKYHGHSVLAIIARKEFMSLYPFGSVDRLGLDLSGFECTSGSIHFSAAKPIPDELLRGIVTARLQQIAG